MTVRKPDDDNDREQAQMKHMKRRYIESGTRRANARTLQEKSENACECRKASENKEATWQKKIGNTDSGYQYWNHSHANDLYASGLYLFHRGYCDTISGYCAPHIITNVRMLL